ncbi:MAG TPA: hypothetical protein DF296_05715 [Candidatus Margulisbacteria bacterium]|nr:MAG: hypothetical protein A2X41_12310 [Candidatus Margulisbacteria bacterium GWE2_39_32]HCT84678.1 hypothetical protein [Candidatus Margulisiibacteriota bacterium]
MKKKLKPIITLSVIVLSSLSLSACTSSISSNAGLPSLVPEGTYFVTIKPKILPAKYLIKESRPYLLTPGDIIEITVFNNKDLQRKSIPIAPDGKLYYLLIDPVQAAGRTIEDVAKEVQDKLSHYLYYPQISIVANQLPSQKYTILGHVTKPGLYELKPGVNLLDAIASAGGITHTQLNENYPVDFDHAFIARKGENIIPVNFEKLLKEGDHSQNIYVEAGDFIYLPEITNSDIYILGQIDFPRTMPYKKGLTLIKALAGLTRINYAKNKPYTDSVIILHGSLSKPEITVVNVNNILEARSTDILLQPKDIIYIPEKSFDFDELIDIVTKAYITAFSTKTATYSFDSLKVMYGVNK